ACAASRRPAVPVPRPAARAGLPPAPPGVSCGRAVHVSSERCHDPGCRCHRAESIPSSRRDCVLCPSVACGMAWPPAGQPGVFRLEAEGVFRLVDADYHRRGDPPGRLSSTWRLVAVDDPAELSRLVAADWYGCRCG